MRKVISLLIMSAMFASLCVVNVAAQVPETNIIPNGAFETQADIDTAGISDQLKITLAQGAGFDGNNCAEVDKSLKGVAGDVRIYAQELKDAKKGEKYYISAKVKMKNAGATATVRWAVGLSDSSQWYVNNSNSPFKGTNSADLTVTDEWTLLSDTIIVPNDYTRTETPFFMLRFTSDDQDEWYLDDFKIVSLTEGNLVLNPNFDDATVGWSVRDTKDNGKLEAQATGGVDNSACMKVSCVGSAGDVIQTLDGMKDAKAGDKYYISAKFKLESGTGSARFAAFQNGTAGYIASAATDITTAWTPVNLLFTVTANYTQAPQLYWRINGTDTAYYVDDVSVIKVSNSDFLNPSFEYGLEGWSQSGTGNTVELINDGTAADGDYYAKITASTVTPELNQSYNFVAGRMYEVKAKFKRDANTTDTLYPEFNTGAYTSNNGWIGGAIVTADDKNWVDVRAAFVADATGNKNVMMRLRNAEGSGNKAATYTYCIDDFSITECENTFEENASFENGFTGWSYNSLNHVQTIISDEAADGNNCLQVYAKKDAPDVIGVYPFIEGETYVVSAKFKNTSATTDVPVYPHFFCNGAWKGISATVVENGWVELKTTFVASSPTATNGTAVFIRQRNTINSGNAEKGYIYYIDDFAVRKVDTTNAVWHEATYTGSAKTAGVLSANVELYNRAASGTAHDNFAFLALYDGNGKLIACDVVNNLYAAGTSVGTTQLTVTVPAGGNENGYARVFVWNKDFTPYNEPTEINE